MGKIRSRGGRSLHVFGALARGGAETWFLQALARRGESSWSADVCLLAGEEGACVPEARRLGLRVLHCPYRPAAGFPARLLALLRRERYDAVHSHVLLFGGLIAALAERAGAPLRVVHAHNSSDGRADSAGRALYRALMRRMIAEHANLGLACSREAAGMLGCAHTRLLPYGIDLAPFEAPLEGLKSRFGIPAEAPVVGAVGRLTRQKNHAFLLEAFTASRLEDLHLVIAGDGELRGELEQRADALGVRDRVHLLGLRGDVPALLLGLCDSFAIPSMYEGLPVALLEAQAAGLPCLVSANVSPEAVVLPGQVERLPLDTAAWAEGLGKLAQRPRVEPSAAVARLREAGFDAADSWPRLTALYETALAGAGKAQAA